MSERTYALYLLADTGMMTKYHDSISSPVYYRMDNGCREHLGRSEHPHFKRAGFGACWFDRNTQLIVRTPGGDWNVDRPSSCSGGLWTRNGVVPMITVTPSIKFTYEGDDLEEQLVLHGVRNYHAMLTNGVLNELDDTFPG